MAEIAVFDASAMLALLQNEPGSEEVIGVMENEDTVVLVSSVNLCEVGTKLVKEGRSAAQVFIGLEPFLKYAVDFDSEQAIHAAELSRSTKSAGLSLGDRACLALGLSRRATVWTTDRVWKKLKIGVEIRLLRG